MTTPVTTIQRGERTVRIELHDLQARLLEVVRIEQLTPRMLRLILTGSDIDGFVDRAPQDHVKLIFPEPGERYPTMPTKGAERDGLDWPTEPPFPITRDYTVRYYDEAARELAIDIVLHEDGVVGDWIRAARPGDPLGVAGPRGSVFVPAAFDWYLLGADETALPCLARWVAELPAGQKVIAVIEVADEGERQHLPTGADADIRWVYRHGRPAGTTTALLDGIRGVELPPGDGFAWVAGEAVSLRPIRRYLRDEVGLAKDQLDVDGYWRIGVQDLDHHLADPDEDAVDPAAPADRTAPAANTVTTEEN